jgi:hypothetical protein
LHPSLVGHHPQPLNLLVAPTNKRVFYIFYKTITLYYD